MLIVGLDTGSKKCGYAVLDLVGGKPEYVECGVIIAPANDNGWARIAHIADHVRELLVEFHLGRGDRAGIETAYVPRNRGANGVEMLAQCRGALAYVCISSGLDVAFIAPSTAKKAATGYGGSKKSPVDKGMVSEALRVRFGLRNAPDPDAADALAIALAVAGGSR